MYHWACRTPGQLLHFVNKEFLGKGSVFSEVHNSIIGLKSGNGVSPSEWVECKKCIARQVTKILHGKVTAVKEKEEEEDSFAISAVKRARKMANRKTEKARRRLVKREERERKKETT